jgi:hypothetical protein
MNTPIYQKMLSRTFFFWLGCLSTIATADCTLTKEFTFPHSETSPVQVFRDSGSKAIAFASQMQVNTDGAPDSYHPDDIGITHICNGVSIGANCTWKPKCLAGFNQAKAEQFKGPTKICFFAMVTDVKSTPIIQGQTDPKPGYFVSTTALHQPGENLRTPQAQLDSNIVNFAVIPGTWQRSGNPGPKNKLGEGSVALHQVLGNDPFMDRFGVRRARKGIGGRDVVYLLFPNSVQPGQKFDTANIDRFAGEQLKKFGGLVRVKECAESLAK